MVANKAEQRKQMSYQEVWAALPAYAQGTLDPQQQAAVDAYLNRQVDLFRQLDMVEAEQAYAAINSAPLSAPQTAPQSSSEQRQLQDAVAFAQVMEGYTPPQALPGNPLLMRKAPQRITDHRTGQRFIVPRQSSAQSQMNLSRYPQGEQPIVWANHLLWGVLALAAVVAMILIGSYQLHLQQQLTAAENALAARQRATLVTSQPRVVDLFDATPPITVWLMSDSQPISPLGTLFIDGQQGLLVIHNLPPLPAAQIYQLWRIDNRTDPTRMASFAVTDSQQAQWIPFALSSEVDTMTQIAVSVEPASGSNQPSGDFLLTTALR